MDGSTREIWISLEQRTAPRNGYDLYWESVTEFAWYIYRTIHKEPLPLEAFQAYLLGDKGKANETIDNFFDRAKLLSLLINGGMSYSGNLPRSPRPAGQVYLTRQAVEEQFRDLQQFVSLSEKYFGLVTPILLMREVVANLDAFLSHIADDEGEVTVTVVNRL